MLLEIPKKLTYKERLRGYQKSLRENATPAEIRFKELLYLVAPWEKVVINKLFIINGKETGYFADFYIKKHKLIFEIDGGYHDNISQIKKDRIRSDYLINVKKVNIIRFKNEIVLSMPEFVMEQIVKSLGRKIKDWQHVTEYKTENVNGQEVRVTVLPAYTEAHAQKAKIKEWQIKKKKSMRLKPQNGNKNG